MLTPKSTRYIEEHPVIKTALSLYDLSCPRIPYREALDVELNEMVRNDYQKHEIQLMILRTIVSGIEDGDWTPKW